MIIEVILKSNGGNMVPADCRVLSASVAELVVPAAMGGVILSGRAPVWAFAAMTHAAHPAAWVATFDPRLGGAVVVASHTPTVKVGDIVPLDGHDKVTVEV